MKYKQNKGFTVGELIITLIALAASVGYVLNIVKMIQGFILLDNISNIGGLLILRVIGIFAVPVGCIAGFF